MPLTMLQAKVMVWWREPRKSELNAMHHTAGIMWYVTVLCDTQIPIEKFWLVLELEVDMGRGKGQVHNNF